MRVCYIFTPSYTYKEESKLVKCLATIVKYQGPQVFLEQCGGSIGTILSHEVMVPTLNPRGPDQ